MTPDGGAYYVVAHVNHGHPVPAIHGDFDGVLVVSAVPLETVRSEDKRVFLIR